MARITVPGTRLECPVTHELYRAAEGVYVIVCIGVFTSQDAQIIRETRKASHGPAASCGVIYLVDERYTGHSPEVRKREGVARTAGEVIAVVTNRPAVRVPVALASGLLVALKQRPIKVFRELAPAIDWVSVKLREDAASNRATSK